MDAIVRTGGKQYRVHEGEVLDVASLNAEPGSQVELRDVLLVADGGSVSVGTPNVQDAVVVAEVLAHGKAPKVVNFKFKAKVRYRRKRGHRQDYTRLAVQEIRVGAAGARRPARRRTEAQEPGEQAPEPRRGRGQAEFAGRSPEPEAPAPRRRRAGSEDAQTKE